MTRDEAREETLRFFAGVKLNESPSDPRVSRVVRSSEKARRLQDKPLKSGESYLDLKENALAGYDEHIPAAEYEELHAFAQKLAEQVVDAFPAPDEGPMAEWLDDVEGDVRGLFFSLLFPEAAESNEFFALVRHAYASGGVPCAVPKWPGNEVAVFTGEKA